MAAAARGRRRLGGRGTRVAWWSSCNGTWAACSARTARSPRTNLSTRSVSIPAHGHPGEPTDGRPSRYRFPRPCCSRAPASSASSPSSFPTRPRLKALAGASNGSTARVAGDGWLIFPRPRPSCDPPLVLSFAGGGAATYRPWTRYLDQRIELVAIEPPGRQTRIDEPPLRDLPTLVEQLFQHCVHSSTSPSRSMGTALAPWCCSRPSRLDPRARRRAAHVFVSGARPPTSSTGSRSSRSS